MEADVQPLGDSFLKPIEEFIRSEANRLRDEQLPDHSGDLHEWFAIKDFQTAFAASKPYGAPRIECAWWALECLWLLSFAVAQHGPEFVQAIKDNKTEHNLGEEFEKTKLILQRLQHSCRDSSRFNCTNDELNTIEIELTESSITTKIFISALSWVINHEIAHIVTGHLDADLTEITDEKKLKEIRKMEREADDHATAEILCSRALPCSDKIYAICLAISFIGLRNCLQDNPDREHDNPVRRMVEGLIEREVDECHTSILAVAGIMEIFSQSFFPIDRTSREHSSASEWLIQVIADLSIHSEIGR